MGSLFEQKSSPAAADGQWLEVRSPAGTRGPVWRKGGIKSREDQLAKLTASAARRGWPSSVF